jgi:hypothetical protein
MSERQRATTLQEVSGVLIAGPLDANDPWRVDLAPARGKSQLGRMKTELLSARRENAEPLHLAFVGHMGSGKTTELKQLADDLRSEFTPLLIQLDPGLEKEAAYPDVLLWLVTRILDHFAPRNQPSGPSAEPPVVLEQEFVEKITDWFAERTLEKVEETKAQIKKEAEAEAGLKAGWLGNSLKLLARIQSSFLANSESRTTQRRKFDNYTTDLFLRINEFLDHVHAQMRAAGRPDQLLLIQDNLDRLNPEPAQRLFCENGQLLGSLRAYFIWTAPAGLKLAPHRIHFKTHYMPTPAPLLREGGPNQPALDGLRELLAARVDLEAVFDSSEAVHELCRYSGGSLRDLIRLLGDARLEALEAGHPKISTADVKAAAKGFRLELERYLMPGEYYYPMLARIHQTKQDPIEPEDEPGKARFLELMSNGYILQYNGEENWLDVQPALLDSRRFKDALAKLTAP